MTAPGRQRDLLAAGAEPAPLRIAAPDAELRYWPAALAPADADDYLEQLRGQCEWRQHEVRIAGRVIPCPRLSAWHGEPDAVYGYSGSRHVPAPWTPALAELRALAEALTGARYNSVLANLYRDGRDSMGYHSDDEPELGERPVIAAFSFGAARPFVLRHRRRRREPPLVLEPAHGSLLLMAGDTQRNWRHGLPKTRTPCGERLSLTFRLIQA